MVGREKNQISNLGEDVLLGEGKKKQILDLGHD
jgi:hypothetical protein